jgi:rhodanese-related sulfurtransferase
MTLHDMLKWLPFGKVPEVSAEALEQLRQTAGVQLLDVRTLEEWRRSHIPGSINLPITQCTRDHIAALNLDPGRPIVAICLSAHRSRPAVRQLRSMGFVQASQLQGGMLRWWQLELPCERPYESAG